jgi:hypothetical protein
MPDQYCIIKAIIGFYIMLCEIPGIIKERTSQQPATGEVLL